MPDIQFILKAVKGNLQREITGVVPVGRGVLDGVALTEEGTSRKHALLTVENGEVYVEDTSKNGTYINGSRLVGKRRLNAGDRVRFHTQEFNLERIESLKDTIAVAHNPDAAKNRDVEWIRGVKFDDSDHTQQCSPEQFAELQKKSAERRRENLAAPPVNEPCLVFMREGESNTVVPLVIKDSPEQEWIVGRRSECDIHIDAKSVSSVHAKILRVGRQWYAIDAISVNGLFVNGFQVGKQYLSSGDSIRFGNVECIFRLPGRTTAKRRRVPPMVVYTTIVVSVCFVLLAAWWVVKTYVLAHR
jgi:pSer/pThr/pTyr-binding forkhead associated (FHA) protein